MMNNQSLSKKERKELKRQEKFTAQQRASRKQKFSQALAALVAIAIVGGGIAALAHYIKNQPKTPESDIISKTGFHWHPHLTITIKGDDQEIPADIGLGITESPVHTHDATGTIHMEFPGLVTKDDTKLGKFFQVWGKQFNSNCIFDSCNGPDGKVKMFVNGEENSEFENYPMKEGDKIEIRYE